MASLKNYIDAPLFYDDTELSASFLNLLDSNAQLIKNASVLPQPTFDIHRALNVQSGKDTWKGGFQYRTGLTSAIFVIYSKQVTGQGATDMVIYFNDVEVDRYSSAIGGVNVGGYAGRTVAVTGRGYVDYEIVTVRVSPEGTSAEKGIQYVLDAYVEPLSSITGLGTWGGVPSFGTVNATNLNLLSNAEDYLAGRLASIPMPLGMSYIQWMGTNNPAYPDYRYFTARATNGNERLKTNVYYRCYQTQAYIDMTINGVLVASSGPYTSGQQALIQFDVDLIAAGLSWSTDYLGKMSERVTVAGSPSDGHGGYIFSRVDQGPFRMGSSSYALAVPTTSSGINESITIDTLQARLNAIATTVSTAYTRITAATRAYDRATMFRGRFGVNNAQNEYWETVFVPSIYRQGDILWVKGQGLKIAYGSVTQKPKSDAKPNDVVEYEFQFTEELLDGDKVTQSYFYLDQFKGLYPGMRYFVIGKDVLYAAEHLR